VSAAEQRLSQKAEMHVTSHHNGCFPEVFISERGTH
jgi:hypothetical protein